MPRFERADDFVKELASEILCRYPDYQPILDAKVTFDYLFAFGDKDETGIVTTPAITVDGWPALGQCRIVNHRDRTKGCADVEIQLDADWWLSHDRPEQEAVLDHELFHVQLDPKGRKDHGGRPKLHIKPHDHQVGWFRTIAARHGKASQERIQAAMLLEECGQFYWPEILPGTKPVNQEAGRTSQTITIGPKEAEILKAAAGELRKR